MARRAICGWHIAFRAEVSTKIFSAIADTLEWILKDQGVSSVLHYLDDFLTMGPGQSQECGANLTRIRQVCESLGFPLKTSKIEGPSTTLSFLGIRLDTEVLEISLPEHKLLELQALVRDWTHHKAASKRQLLSLIGKLAHACKVVTSGRTFLRRMITLSTRVRGLHKWLHLDRGFKSDLAWWDSFLRVWNARSMMELFSDTWHAAVEFHSDASGSWGCGACTGREWFHCPWGGGVGMANLSRQRSVCRWS